MKLILDIREAIYDYYQSLGCLRVLFENRPDAYAAYYTSMYLIADTGESVSYHMLGDFSSDSYLESCQAYIEFWGVMQAIIIQQDAIGELHEAIFKSALHKQPKSSHWMQLRNIRNLCAGHPAKKTHGESAHKRTFMRRSFGNYNQIKYEMYDASIDKISCLGFNLKKMIDGYDVEASNILVAVLSEMLAK